MVLSELWVHEEKAGIKKPAFSLIVRHAWRLTRW